MELAERERKLIHELGSYHEQTKAARAEFDAAWEKVHLIQRSFGSPSYIKEQS